MPKRSNKKPPQPVGASGGAAAAQPSSRPKTDASASKHGYAAAKRPRTGKADAKDGIAKPRRIKGAAGDEAGEAGSKGPKAGKFGPKRRQPPKGPKEQDIWNSDVALDTAVLEVASKKAGASAAAVTPAVELLRFRKAKMLRSLMHKECKAANVKVPILSFERWLTRCKLEDSKEGGGSKEPLLPEEARLDMGLVRDLVRGKMKEPEARKLATKLSESSAKAAKRLIIACKPGGGDDDQDGKGGLPKAAPIEVSTTPLTKDLAMGTEKPYLQVNHAHYKKLQRLFVRYGLGRTGEAAEAKLSPGESEEFHTRLFCLLARYQALGGHGYQAALSEHGFRVLQKRMETQFECFASPLNCHFGRYCSAFPDTDFAFGSLGSFFSFRPTSGSYEANPPFVPEFMSAMTEHMEALLKKAKGPLSFTVIIPAWKEIHAWEQLESSPFRKTTWVIPASSHIYCDGAQHMRPDRYRPSSFDTAVIFLQNQKGHEKWPPSDDIKEELEEAMRAALSQSAPTIAAYEKKIRKKGKKPASKKGRPRPDASAGDDGEGGSSKANQPSKKRRLTGGKPPSSSSTGVAAAAPAAAGGGE